MAHTGDNPHKKKRSRNNPIGRSQRKAKHRQGQVCGRGNCRNLLDSRVWDKALNCYLAR